MGENNNNNWSCCNDSQSLFLLLYIAFVAIALLTWNSLIAKPMRLIAVFIHEMSHAVACWLTCGSVDRIAVFENEGGVTQYRGGMRCLIIPAGYVGCSFFAMILVIMSGDRVSATVAAMIFIFSLTQCLCYSPNRTLINLCLAYIIITSMAVLIEYYVYTPMLQFVILFYGVFCGIFAVADIQHGTVEREIEGSDAYACHKEVWPCCAPRCIGLQWVCIAIVFQLMGIWIALVEMSEECENMGWLECLNVSVNAENFDFFERNWNFDGFFEHKGDSIWSFNDQGP